MGTTRILALAKRRPTPKPTTTPTPTPKPTTPTSTTLTPTTTWLCHVPPAPRKESIPRLRLRQTTRATVRGRP
eukprot:9086602-Pyramimonas_sp.AAC.1